MMLFTILMAASLISMLYFLIAISAVVIAGVKRRRKQ